MNPPHMPENIANFWLVIDLHRDLLAIPDNDKEDQMMNALRALQEIDPRLYFHIGYRDDGADLLVSAEGNYDLSETMTHIVNAAPNMPGWSVIPILESDALSGQRNGKIFPDDENGDVLYGIAQRAGDLISSRPVDFCHIFPSRASAAEFAGCISEGERLNPERYDGRQGYSWQVVVSRKMVPSHGNVTTTEAHLADIVSQYGGIPDGWGFMSS
ncbi:MAG: hypothetical protein JWO08_1780 [Verrucomicrobiaceae bacterium]|nr:hypothetical protein [Verrucomicrobiaceae bacterium]